MDFAPAQDTPAPPPPPLARAAVDRAGLERTDPAVLGRAWEDPRTRVLRLRGGSAPVRDGRLLLSAPEGPLPEHAVLLGREHSHDDAEHPRAPAIVLVADEVGEAAPTSAPALDGARWLGLRDVAAGLSDADAGLFVAAVAVVNWHATHRFCGRCGGATDIESAGWVRRCRECGTQHFPRTDPAVIVAITDPEDRILLGSNAAWPAGRYSCLAGFVEPGESLEHAVEREVFEESGIRVVDPAYRSSQPWPFPRSLMVGFRARALPGQELVPDGEEIRSVRWFTRAELAAAARAGSVTLPGAVSIARTLIEDWYGGTLPDAQTLIS